MRKLRTLILLGVLFTPLFSWAQFTNVTATVKDPNGNVYANCKYNVDFINRSSLPQLPLLFGSVFQTSFGGVQCDSNGNLSITVADNNLITPNDVVSNWRFSICASNGTTCFVAQLLITGASQNITAALQLAAAPLPGTSFGNITACTINNTCMADCQPGADAGIRIAACITALPNGGFINATGFTPGSTQVFSTDVTAAAVNPYFIFLGPFTVSINHNQSPNTPNIRFLGLGGSGGNGGGTGTGNTTLSVGFASGDVFTPTANASSFEIGNMNIVAGVTRTSGFFLNPAPGANAGYVHDLHIQNQYGTIRLFGGGGVGINNWRIFNLTWNCGSSLLHTGEFITVGSTDINVTSSAHIFQSISSTGDVCLHDLAPIHFGSKTDSPILNAWNFGISRNNTSTVPNILFDNTITGATTTSQPRLVHVTHLDSEGDGLAGNDIIKGSACTDCDFSQLDLGGGDHAVNLSGGNGWHFALSQFANNHCGGIYVTTGTAHIALSIISNNFYGNNVLGGTCYDIQPAAGTSDMDVYSNKFGQIPSTVTANLTTQPINVPGTTSGPFNIAGNTMDQTKYTNTGLVTDYTSYCGFSETEDGRTRFHRGCGSSSSRDIFLGGNAQFCWQIGANENSSNNFELTPSTAACTFGGGFPTFNKPVMIATATGTLIVNGTSQPTLSLTNGANTGVINFQAPTGAGTGTYRFPDLGGNTDQVGATPNLLVSPTAPTIAAAGCGGSAASIATNNGPGSFTINVGTAPTAAGCVVTLPSATNAWNCTVTDITTNSTSVFLQKQTVTGQTSVTLVNFNDVAVATAPTANDIWQVSCLAR